MAAALLIAALAAIALFVRDDMRELARFKALTETRDRQRRYRVWVAKAFVAFTGMSIAGLALVGRLDALWAMPGEFASAFAVLPSIDFDRMGLIGGMLAGGALGGAVLGAVAASRGEAGRQVTLGELDAILPRNRAETWHGALLSLNAGVSEELFFRLYLPLAIVLAGGGAVLAFVVSAVLFGVIHLYQGPVGMVATGLLGAAMTLVYLLSGSLVLPIAIHVLIDLNALVLRPTLTRWMRR